MYILSILMIGILLSCSSRPDPVSTNTVTKSEKHSEVDRKMAVPENHQVYRLWHDIDQFELASFDFFGEFYDDRLKFYYQEDPDMNLGPASVKLLILYFLDDRLVKIRYHLDRNIEDYLMDSLGIGNLKTKYNRKKKVLATKRSLKKLKDFASTKDEPVIYEIAWDRSIIWSSYNVNDYSNKYLSFDTISARYVFIDQLKSYKRRLMEIENERVALLKPDASKTNGIP